MSTLSVESKRGAWHAIGEYALAAVPRALRGSIAIVAFIALWEVLPRAGWVDATFLPPFSTVLHALFDMIVSGELGVHLLASTARAATGSRLRLPSACRWGCLSAGIARLPMC
ncbi:hypothetical protein [Paraburkholderia terrae]